MTDEQPLTHKFVAVLNKKIPEGKAMNALAHMAAGLVAAYPELKEMRFDSYFDQDGNDHQSISEELRLNQAMGSPEGRHKVEGLKIPPGCDVATGLR